MVGYYLEYNDNCSCCYSTGVAVSRSGGNIELWNELYQRGSYVIVMNLVNSFDVSYCQ